MRKNKQQYLWGAAILLIFLAPVYVAVKRFWPGDTTLKAGPGLWDTRGSVEPPRPLLSSEAPRTMMHPLANSKRNYGKEGGLYGEKLDADYGEQVDGVAAEEREKKRKEAELLAKKGLGGGERIDGVPVSPEASAASGGGSGEGISHADGGVQSAGALAPLAAPGNSGWASGGSSAGGASGDLAGKRVGVEGSGRNTGPSSTLKAGERLRGGKTSSANSAQMRDSTSLGKSVSTTFGASSDGRSQGAAVSGVGSGASMGGIGGPSDSQNTGGTGIGGKISAPDTGAGEAVETGKSDEDVKADNCSQLTEGCAKIYADYDRSIASTEAELQTCTKFVDMGKSGMVQVVDQACFNRVNAKLLSLRAERDGQVKECQKGQDSTCGK
ncbi:MAG: hypothetical protein WC969_00900 [Elusimicrobiota bacterium]|jgi:hypothetical protein